MIKVYLESGSHAELVATFMSEDTYLMCLPAIKKQAKNHRCFVTESEVDVVEIEQGAQELIDCGNSKEKAEGHGMLNVYNELLK